MGQGGQHQGATAGTTMDAVTALLRQQPQIGSSYGLAKRAANDCIQLFCSSDIMTPKNGVLLQSVYMYDFK